MLYSNQEFMKYIVRIKRYIDDGIGIHTMTTFTVLKTTISKGVLTFGLKIKESDRSEPNENHDMINFLYIEFSFDKQNQLQTGLYKKPTDARCFLNYSSCHP